MKKISRYLAFGLFVLWVALHIPGIFYGTKDVALHQSYVGDEQSPVNGAFHILEDRSLLALRDNKNVYYGPLFSVVALPAVALDAGAKLISGQVDGPQGYKNLILRDWGGIIWKSRLLAVVAMYLGLVACFRLLSLRSINPSRTPVVPWVGTLLLASNFYFFEYSHFFKHWAFLVPILLGQLYVVARLLESKGRRVFLWVAAATLTILGFGITYLTVVFQVMWVPVIVRWIIERERHAIRAFLYYALAATAFAALIIYWHPHAFLRTFGLTVGDVVGGGTAAFTTEVEAQGYSFWYYLKLITINHFALVVGWLTLCVVSIRTTFTQTFSQVLLVTLATYFLIFGLISHHESRYALPLLVLGMLHSLFLFAHYRARADASKRILTLIMLCAVVTLVTHVVHSAGWIVAYSKPPAEQVAIGKLAERPNDGGKILVVGSYILGVPHTADAYRAYMKASNKEEVNLYKKLIETPVPERYLELDVYYAREEDFFQESELAAEYDSIVLKTFPRQGELNQFDYIDENITRIWWYDELLPTYTILK